jgi:hypothetical protein
MMDGLLVWMITMRNDGQQVITGAMMFNVQFVMQ